LKERRKKKLLTKSNENVINFNGLSARNHPKWDKLAQLNGRLAASGGMIGETVQC
jgi:hypothetical protein